MQSNGLHNVVACQGSDKTALEQRPMPEVGAGELLLKLRVVGFCGTDLFKLNTGSASVGTVLGHELVGEVVAVGDGVEGFNVGNRVAVPHHVPCGKCVVCRRGNETMCETFRENLMEPGGFADTVLIRPRAVELAAHVLPDHVSDEAAVFVEPAACVLRGVERSGITAEGTAVVLGGGSMGLLHLLVLHAALPGVKVIVIDPVPERRELALELGAAKAAMPGNEALAVVKSLTDDTGADAIFDTVGGNRTLQAGLDLSRQGGSIV
ncbi:MAG: alcohol dehydrogenase catalytic domain-containing protein, partial [Rhodospirillales bacterium]|nr:alcohol dehydrogenase catalytic domain-containing protein [Rhodospirillales bacterium]